MIFAPFFICVNVEIYNCFLAILEQCVLADIGESFMSIYEHGLLQLNNYMTCINVRCGFHCLTILYIELIFDWAMYPKFLIGHNASILSNHGIQSSQRDCIEQHQPVFELWDM